MQTNPLLSGLGIPQFDKIEPTHVVPAITSLLASLEQDLKNLEASHQTSWSGLVEPLMAMGEKLRQGWGPVLHLSAVKNSEALRAAIEEVQPRVVEFGLRFSQSEALYNGLRALQGDKAFANFSAGQKRTIELNLIAAERSGIALKGEEKKRFNELSKELSELATKFSNNILDAVKDFEIVLTKPNEILGLQKSHLASFSQRYKAAKGDSTPEHGPWLLTLDGPSYLAFMENSQNRELREKLYRAFVSKASKGPYDNTALVSEILQKRQAKAKLLGYGSYAELSLSEKMARDVPAVYKLLEDLKTASFSPAKKELEEIEAFARKGNFVGTMMPWDLPYWAKRLEEDRYSYTEEELRPYFPIEQVLTGLFGLVKEIFAIEVVACDGEVPVWHPDVRYFKIYDDKRSHLASFFLDPYSRPEDKRGGAWMNECVPRTVVDGKLVHVPVAYLVCNSGSPVDGKPCLMTFSEVETLFHEFGHGLQHMLTEVDVLDVAGISGIEWDAVELPSQFMENWCYHEPTLRTLSGHYQTKAPLPESFITKVKAAKNYRAAQLMLRQLQFALIDMRLHHDFPESEDQTPFALAREIAKETSVIAPIPEDFFLCSFSHIFSGGYAAGYYSYKWAEVLSADAFEAFVEVGLANQAKLRDVGRKFRSSVLALGGSKPAKEVFEIFRGRLAKPDALLRHSGLLPS